MDVFFSSVAVKSPVDTGTNCAIIIPELHSKSIFGEPDVPVEIGRRNRALTREPDTDYAVAGKDADQLCRIAAGRICNAIPIFIWRYLLCP